MESQVRDRGRLFAVHGRMEGMVRDAAIVPVDRRLDFNPAWSPLIGERPGAPDRWAERGWGRLHAAPERVWVVCTGATPPDPYATILERVDLVARRVSDRREAHAPVRGAGSRPLLAVPVIGIGYGGYGADRGEVIRALVEHLGRTADEADIDIVLVTPEPSVYAAVQYARRKVSPALQSPLEKAAKDLAQRSTRGELALLLGAGVGVPAGLPTWHRLIEQLSSDVGMAGVDLSRLHLTSTDQAELIERREPRGFQNRVAERITPHRSYSLLHGFLAGLDAREVVTTNYDLLYERAVEATGHDIRSVMPWGSAHGAERWILKLHGDVSRPESIVLTRRHMVTYDSLNRPSGALLQSLLLTRHLLMVGVSMTDDNVIRLAHEVQAYRDTHQMSNQGAFGTLLDVGGDPVRSELWEGQLDWIRLPQTSGLPGPRAIEVLLDRIAMLASQESSWVLDPRFAGLLEQGERDVAEQARALLHALPGRPGTKWESLVMQLRAMGAG